MVAMTFQPRGTNSRAAASSKPEEHPVIRILLVIRGSLLMAMSPSSFSHIVTNTERRLGIRPFQRNTRSVSLTEAGDTLLARPALTEITDAIEGVHHFCEKPAGLIRLNASTWAADRILAPFNMAVDSKLRDCDLVYLKVQDVFATGRAQERASVTQSKTGKPAPFEITETTRQSLERWIADPEMIGLEQLWPSRLHRSAHLSTLRYARILRDWVLRSAWSRAPMVRRTKVAQIYKKTGICGRFSFCQATPRWTAPFDISASTWMML